MTATGMAILVTPGGKTAKPLVGMKSLVWEAVPSTVLKATETGKPIGEERYNWNRALVVPELDSRRATSWTLMLGAGLTRAGSYISFVARYAPVSTSMPPTSSTVASARVVAVKK